MLFSHDLEIQKFLKLQSLIRLAIVDGIVSLDLELSHFKLDYESINDII